MITSTVPKYYEAIMVAVHTIFALKTLLCEQTTRVQNRRDKSSVMGAG